MNNIKGFGALSSNTKKAIMEACKDLNKEEEDMIKSVTHLKRNYIARIDLKNGKYMAVRKHENGQYVLDKMEV